MSKFKLTFKLKQHTPIIHFQHDETGATLRATELKPKLDKFLIKKFKQQGIDYSKWLIGDGEHPALDYKVRVESNSDVLYYLPYPLYLNNQKQKVINENISINFNFLMPSPFFANADKIKIKGNNQNGYWLDTRNSNLDEIRYGVFANSLINAKITSFNTNKININNNYKTLLETIEENLIDFFLSTNFGTRQNKGFGSFTVDSINDNKLVFDENRLKNVFDFVYKNNDTFSSVNQIFKSINQDYQKLKSGINHPTYEKSLLFLYFVKLNNPIRWEKRNIKQEIKKKNIHINKNGRSIDLKLKVTNENSAIYDENGNQSWVDSPNSFTYKYIRALLGLAETFEFLIKEPPNKEKYVVKVKSNNGIERFQSPLTFKVINNTIYLVANNINKDITDKSFDFELDFKNKDNNSNYSQFSKDLINKMHTPTNFNIGDFLDFATTKCNCNEQLKNYSIIPTPPKKQN